MLSIEEIDERIELLQREIDRLKEARTRKEASRRRPALSSGWEPLEGRFGAISRFRAVLITGT